MTGLKHVAGMVSMARGGPDSATAEFFILLDDQPSLDFGGKRFDDEQGAAAFGRVVSGLDVVRKIQQQPVRTGEGQNPQSLAEPVQITRIVRIKADARRADERWQVLALPRIRCDRAYALAKDKIPGRVQEGRTQPD